MGGINLCVKPFRLFNYVKSPFINHMPTCTISLISSLLDTASLRHKSLIHPRGEKKGSYFAETDWTHHLPLQERCHEPNQWHVNKETFVMLSSLNSSMFLSLQRNSNIPGLCLFFLLKFWLGLYVYFCQLFVCYLKKKMIKQYCNLTHCIIQPSLQNVLLYSRGMFTSP